MTVVSDTMLYKICYDSWKIIPSKILPSVPTSDQSHFANPP